MVQLEKLSASAKVVVLAMKSANVLSGPRGKISTSSPQREPAQTKRIPEGQILGVIQLEAAKAFPTLLYHDLKLEPRIAYADLNTHGEKNSLTVKYLPNGAKTAPHPQVVFFVNGRYHVESLGYTATDPLTWSTWMEFHLDARQLKHLIDAVFKAEIAWENRPR